MPTPARYTCPRPKSYAVVHSSTSLTLIRSRELILYAFWVPLVAPSIRRVSWRSVTGGIQSVRPEVSGRRRGVVPRRPSLVTPRTPSVVAGRAADHGLRRRDRSCRRPGANVSTAASVTPRRNRDDASRTDPRRHGGGVRGRRECSPRRTRQDRHRLATERCPRRGCRARRGARRSPRDRPPPRRSAGARAAAARRSE